MDITLKKKNDPSDFDPLIVMIEEEDDSGKKMKKRLLKIKIGETVTLPDHEAHYILSKYRGMFELKVPAAGYKTKDVKPAND
jgi:hypothetical protein